MAERVIPEGSDAILKDVLAAGGWLTDGLLLLNKLAANAIESPIKTSPYNNPPMKSLLCKPNHLQASLNNLIL